jgi:hypothetical protein
MPVKHAKASAPRIVAPLPIPAVSAGELAVARDRLVWALIDAHAILRRALDECPRDPGGTTDVYAATAALGPERAGLARDLLQRLGLVLAPLAEVS